METIVSIDGVEVRVGKNDEGKISVVFSQDRGHATEKFDNVILTFENCGVPGVIGPNIGFDARNVIDKEIGEAEKGI